MVQSAIAGGKVGSLKNLKASLKTQSGPLTWIPKEGGITVRFLEEPDEWFGFYEHWDETIRKSYPCIEGQCPGCATDARRSFRYVANALDVEKDKVIALLMPKDLVNRLTARYERYETLMDRDYELFRSGDGLDTVYDATPEAPKKRALSKYELIDLGDALQKVWDSVWGGNGDDDDDDEEETPRSRSRSRQSARSASATRGKKDRRSKVEEEEPEEDEDEEDEEEEDDYSDITLDDLEEMNTAELKAAAESLGVSVKPEKGKARISAAQLKTRLIEELGLDEEDDDEYDDDDEEDAEDDGYSEDELNALSMSELREVARDWDIATAKKSKSALIEEIIEAQDEDA